MKRTVLLLKDPELYEISEEVKIEELQQMKQMQEGLEDTLLTFRARYETGRTTATPQIGMKGRAIYRHLGTPVLFVNPRLPFPKQDMIDVLDDCMLFPGLLIKVGRYKRYIIYYKDLDWNDCSMELEGDMSELIRHGYDHLDGVLTTLRAVDERASVVEPHWWIVRGSYESTQTFQTHKRDDTG